MKSSTALILTSLLPLIIAQYVLEDDYSVSSFASMFDFYTGADPTNGYVTYVDQPTAESTGLYSTSNGSVYMGVDSTSIVSGSGRNSLRVTSKKSYNHGLIILDLAHAPGGQCGTWPAFWMLGPDWPNNGELDIYENVNAATTNTMTLHTNSGCSITNTGAFSGTIETSDCDINDPNQAANQGCAIKTTNDDSFGTGFNNNGGGVYATEWTSEAISIWYFPRSAIPSDITSGTPNPVNWGLALSSFSGACDIDSHVDNMQLVFDTTFCGDWAGNTWGSDSTCLSLAATCQDYVQNNPSAFADTYWSVNSLRVYQSSGVAVTTTASVSSTTASTTTASTLTATVTISSIVTTASSSAPTSSSYTNTYANTYTSSYPSYTWSTNSWPTASWTSDTWTGTNTWPTSIPTTFVTQTWSNTWTGTPTSAASQTWGSWNGAGTTGSWDGESQSQSQGGSWGQLGQGGEWKE